MDTARIIEDIAIAMLAVNNYPLEKAQSLRSGLREQGWFEPEKVTKWTHQEAVSRLVTAGFNRGPGFNTRFADRLQELALHARDKGFASLGLAIERGDRQATEQELLSIYGVGPAAVRSFWAIQRSK